MLFTPDELRLIETLVEDDPGCRWLKVFGPVRNPPDTPKTRALFAEYRRRLADMLGMTPDRLAAALDRDPPQ